MFSKSGSKKWRSLMIALCSLVLLALAGSSVSAAPSCRKISGKFTLQAITGPECTSSVGVCAAGSYKGDIAATNIFIGTSLIQTVDTPTTGVVLLTGDNTFTTSDGVLFTKDAIALKTAGEGEFAEVDTIIGGTGAWAGKTGTFQATGTFINGSGEGEYSGQVCSP